MQPRFFAAVAVAATALAASASAAVTVTAKQVDQLYTATGQTILWDFDTPGIADPNTLFSGEPDVVRTAIENPISTSAPPPLTGGVTAYYDSNGHPYAADPTPYASVQGGKSATFKTLNGYYLTSFSFYMGSPDYYNHVTFHFADGSPAQPFNGEEIWNGGQAGNGDRTKGFRVYYSFAGAHVNQITFASDTNAFEFDGLAGSLAVPEPATWALMIGGFGAAGAMLRRRRVAV